MAGAENNRRRLLEEAQRGNDDALAELIESCRPVLRADARGSLEEVRGRIEESDIVQMTWWSAFRDFPRFEGDVDAFVGWLRCLHERNIRDVVRDQHAAKRAIRREVEASEVLPMVAGRQTSPSQNLVRIEVKKELEHCLESLPAAQRQALRLRFYEGLSVSDMVTRMGRSETAVAGLLKRGLSALRRLLDEKTP